jgi:hypothetical protein
MNKHGHMAMMDLLSPFAYVGSTFGYKKVCTLAEQVSFQGRSTLQMWMIFVALCTLVLACIAPFDPDREQPFICKAAEDCCASRTALKRAQNAHLTVNVSAKSHWIRPPV